MSHEVAVPGQLLGGRFRVERELGAGGMAVVFEATDTASGQRVALKLLRPEIARDQRAADRLEREGEVLTRLRHAAVVAVHSYGRLDSGELYLTMELLEGETLGDRLRRAPMEPLELAAVLAGAAAGLEAAHGVGVIHRDLKPDNIFLCPAPGGGVQVKLLDFGISKVVDRERLTQTGQILGTPRYMAPEQLSADPTLDGRTDVYALGVILYEALAGQPPFPDGAPADLIVAILHGRVTPLRVYRPEIDRDLEAVIQRAMARAREARFPTPAALAEAFLAAVSQPPQEDGQPGGEGGPRPGMATTALGSMGVPAPPAGPAPAVRRGALEPGTFSELQASTAAPAQSGSGRSAATLPHGMSEVSLPAMRSPAAAARPAASPETPGTAPADSAPAAGPPLEASGPYAVAPAAPRRGSAVPWILLALLAGGLFAGGGLLVLFLMSQEGDAPPASAPPSPPAPSPSVEAAPAPAPEPTGLATPAVGPDGGGDRGVDDPEGEVAEPEPSVEEAREPHRRRRRRRAEAPPPAAPPPPPDVPPALTTARDLLQEARAARSAGDAERCVELAGQALERGGGAAALRIQGDCLVRAGRREEGLRAYERYCVLFRDHPGITEVRGLVDGMGGDCR